MKKINRPTWAEINLDNLAFNFRSVKNYVGEDIKYMAVVKADAYGHGAYQCARRLEKEGIDWFGVALPSEGVELRKKGILKRILCLGSFWDGQEKQILNYNLTPVIYQIDQARKFNEAAKARGTFAEYHVKIDTGMGRIGVRFDEVNEFIEELKKFKNIHLEGLMTHFASADNFADNDFTNLQIERFQKAREVFNSNGFKPIYNDLANSSAALAHPKSYGNMVRLGGILYGLGKDVLPTHIELPELKPVLSLYSKIAHVKTVPAGETLGYGRTYQTPKESKIATIPIGYQDGYSRGLSNCSQAIINNLKVPIVGRVSMDWTIADITEIPNAKIGDRVILIGEQSGLKISAADLAGLTDTISYEITCGINRRVPRKYVESE
jgi:alanine racemase